MLRRLVPLALLIAAVAVALVAGPASAAKPVRPAPEPCSGPTLLGPSSVAVGESYTITGCGFPAGALVPLEVTAAGGCCLAINRVADENGRFSYTDSAYAAGYYRTRALQKSHSRWTVAAEWSFTAG